MVFDDIISDIFCEKKLSPIVTELFIWVRKLKIYLAFITQSYFAIPENIRLNSMHYLIMKIQNKQEFNYSSDKLSSLYESL